MRRGEHNAMEAFNASAFVNVDDFRAEAVAKFTPNARNYYEV